MDLELRLAFVKRRSSMREPDTRATELLVVPKSMPTCAAGFGGGEAMKGYYGAERGPRPVSIESDLEMIRQQEQALWFDAFSTETAWRIGNRLRADAIARAASMTFEVQVAGRTLFYAASGFAPADQMEWIRRKRNVVMRFARSSY